VDGTALIAVKLLPEPHWSRLSVLPMKLLAGATEPLPGTLSLELWLDEPLPHPEAWPSSSSSAELLECRTSNSGAVETILGMGKPERWLRPMSSPLTSLSTVLWRCIDEAVTIWPSPEDPMAGTWITTPSPIPSPAAESACRE
jgi:hypothetical protein